MIKAARKFRVFEHEAALWAWLSQIARNALVDYAREQSRFMLQEHHVAKAAELKAERIISQAQLESDEIM